jgi:hypothetical protein
MLTLASVELIKSNSGLHFIIHGMNGKGVTDLLDPTLKIKKHCEEKF